MDVAIMMVPASSLNLECCILMRLCLSGVCVFFFIFCNFVKVCIIEYCINYCFMAQTELDHNVHSIRFMHEHVMNIGISCQFEWSVLFLYGKSVIYGG